MKGLVVLLVVLVILGAVVFYLGWIQIKLDEDSYALVFTKTGGWEVEVIAPGTFSWRWQRLLPTNLTLHVFTLTPHLNGVSFRGSLPSASAYGALLENTTPFDYVIAVDVAYRLKPESLPALARDAGLRAETQEDYYGRTDNEMTQVINESTLRLLADPGAFTPPQSGLTIVADTLTATLERRFPDLDILSVSPTRLEIPDSDLYVATRERYLTVLDSRAAAMRAAAGRMADQQSATDVELARLERYGEILERYPILLEYFRLAQDIGLDGTEFETFVLPASP